MLWAVPELHFNVDFFEFARKRGIITPDEAAAYVTMATRLRQGQKSMRFVMGMKNQTLLQRIMTIAPEIMSVRTIDWLRSADLITVTQGHALRIALRGAGALLPSPLSYGTIGNRMGQLFGATVSNEMISMIREMDDARINHIRQILLTNAGTTRLSGADAAYIREMAIISIARAQRARSGVAAGRILATTAKSALAANNRWDAVTIALSGILSDEMLKNAIRAGAISPARYDLIRALEVVGLDMWRKGLKAQSYDSWAARALLISEGVLSQEMIDALLKGKLIDKKLAMFLRPSAVVIRAITRGQLSQYMVSDKFRVVPGEAPIKTFARVSATTDRALLKLLSEAAQDAQKDVDALAKSRAFGKLTRARQERMVVAQLHQQMRIVWENVGYLTIFGEKEAARAAIAANQYLQRHLLAVDPQVARMLEMQARAGVDSFISRQENLQQLSPRVYKNWALSRQRVQREVNKALLRGLDAREVASIVSRMIRPNVPGGVSYAAMRLARTEINNAFHFTQIRHTREMPWVTGYKWNLSGSHPEPDICNDMANRNHDGIGRGVYKKKNVPGKPHPHCFCFLTTVTASKGDFEAQLRRGSYDKYLRTIEKKGMFQAPSATDKTVRSAGLDWATEVAKVAGKVFALGAGAATMRGLLRD